MKEGFRSNCYWFVYAGLNNVDEEFFKDSDDLNLVRERGDKLKKIDRQVENTADAILEVFDLSEDELKVLELFDGEKRSQHVAFIDALWKFYDQNGPDGEVRLKWSLEDLLYQYKKLFWTAYYQVHSLNKEQESQTSLFLDSLMGFKSH